MKIPNYYRDTCIVYNRAYNVISFEEYKAKMLADSPKTKSLIIWNWVAPGACYGNALFICSFNCILKQYGERCHYCEGLAISKVALNMPEEQTILAVHHSFIYSNRYECYVDCTPGNQYPPNRYLYLLSDELKDDALEEFLESLISEDEDGEEVTTPRFILDDLPLGADVPKDWLLSNEKD